MNNVAGDVRKAKAHWHLPAFDAMEYTQINESSPAPYRLWIEPKTPCRIAVDEVAWIQGDADLKCWKV